MILVVVFTPLQYLNAVAYKNQFNKECEFIVLTTEKRNIAQIETLDKDGNCIYPLRSIQFLPDDILWAIKILYVYFCISIKKYSKIIVGNYNNVAAFCLALRFQNKNKDLIFVDDGLATVNIYKERNEKKLLRSTRLFGGRIMFFMRFILKYKYLHSIIFYSCIDLEHLYVPLFDKIIRQEFELENNEKEFTKEIWFIGSPLLEGGLIDEKDFDEAMLKVRDYTKSKKVEFKYILHRFENIKDEFNCVKFDLPIETVLSETDLLPIEVISFYSAALINIASLYPQIRCLYINLYKKDKIKYQTLKSVYDIFEVHNNLKSF